MMGPETPFITIRGPPCLAYMFSVAVAFSGFPVISCGCAFQLPSLKLTAKAIEIKVRKMEFLLGGVSC